jgi:hypothetical protein
MPDAVALPDFQSKSIFFRCSTGPEPGRHLYIVCVYFSEVPHLRRYVVAPVL